MILYTTIDDLVKGSQERLVITNSRETGGSGLDGKVRYKKDKQERELIGSHLDIF